MKKTKRFLVGIALLPVCYGVLLALLTTLSRFRNVPEGSLYFFSGVLAYFAFEWVFFRPMRTYVFGHELTHALAAWSSGGSVKKFHVSKKGGSVHVSKTNVWVALAPYILPLYGVLLLVAIYVGNLFWPISAYRPWLLSLTGASLGFHAALTIYALRQRQPDLRHAGPWLSGILIFLGNAIFLVLILGVLFPRTVSWRQFLKDSGRHTAQALAKAKQGGTLVFAQTSSTKESYGR